MKVLHLDIGNTRAKYRVLNGGDKIAGGWCGADTLHNLIGLHDIKTALISCVAATAVRKSLTKDLSQAGVEKIWWAETMAQFGRVSNAYKDPEKLGVDRWLAIMAAYNKFGKACCIFDFGSAVTVDFVNEDGQHLGGYITPGSALCFASLNQNTAALRPSLMFSQSTCPGTDTETCIQNGIYLQQTGFVLAVLGALRDEFVVCTGGGFKQMESLFVNHNFIFEPDLVLDGLQMAFTQDAG